MMSAVDFGGWVWLWGGALPVPCLALAARLGARSTIVQMAERKVRFTGAG